MLAKGDEVNEARFRAEQSDTRSLAASTNRRSLRECIRARSYNPPHRRTCIDFAAFIRFPVLALRAGDAATSEPTTTS